MFSTRPELVTLGGTPYLNPQAAPEIHLLNAGK
jgi:hypothetical protein